MITKSHVPLENQEEKQSFLVELGHSEKQLWALIYSKGLLHSDVQDLYRKVRSSYEKIILNDHEQLELQDVEYSLWKLHYKHIDEFRKRIKKTSADGEIAKMVMTQNVANVQRSDDKHIAGFKSFLSEATEFYQNLIVKIRKCYRLPEGSLFYKKGGISTSVEPKKMQKCQFLCHRFLVCLGDLARYTEQCEKPDVQNHNWSVAATRYLEATMIWPDSGNPQNQLAVLAIYVGDEFLALYHCVRSLAVKEPFPDAWDNLILLFERNRSSPLHSLSQEAHFEFLKPSERSNLQIKSESSVDFSNCNMLKAKHNCSIETDLWSLVIRTMSFFFIKSSSEEFSCALASAMRELDALMALDDTKLIAALQSYQCLDSARTGPFRSLQVVSVFIFIIENLINSPQIRSSKDKNDMQQLVWIQFALTTAFIVMGRLVDRCLKASTLHLCPLLPPVLVFVEWLVGMLDEAKTYGVDEKSTSAISYFFGAFVDLLKRFNVQRIEAVSPDSTPLWEDNELRGFAPLACAHVSLDFSTPLERMDSFESGTECRAQRIINAAMKLAKRSDDSGKWIFYDKSGRNFYTGDSDEYQDRKESEKVESTNSDLKVKEPNSLHIYECEEQILKANQSVNGKSVAIEEEEVILFKPLTRYNSAPLYTCMTTYNQMSSEDTGDRSVPSSDEFLRRATSLLIAQNQAQSDPAAFHTDITNFRYNGSSRQPEPFVKDEVLETPISAGPPSLSAWVFNNGSFGNEYDREKGMASKRGLSPIEEIPFAGLSISENENTVISSDHESETIHYSSSPTYSPPVPSAPLLPDNAVWFSGIPSTFSDLKSSGGIRETDNFRGVSQVSSHSNWTAATHGPPDYGHGVRGYVDAYPPFHPMTSSEWLRQYRQNHNLEQAGSHLWPVPFYAPGPGNLGNFQDHEASKFDVFDRWGNPLAYRPPLALHPPAFPLVYGADAHRTEKLFHGYQRPSPYGCGVVTDLGDDHQPQPLLQYLKDREWQLQRDPTLRGPTYMGN